MADGKWIEGLTSEMTLAAAASLVLSARFKVVQLHLPLAVEKASEDPEHVHQLRVGTRRAAAALRVFADCLPRKHHRTAKRSLRVIRQAAGDARDWDVFLQGLPGAKPLASSSGIPALDFLIGYAMGEREAAQARLVSAAGAAAADFNRECEQIPSQVHAPKGEHVPATFGELGTTTIGQLLTALTAAAESNPSNPGELHQLRILAKRVRYALEIFADCFPPIFKERIYPAVENVQELLGEVQDATVGLSRLASLRERLKKSVAGEWPRLQKGIEGLMQSKRTKIPAGRKAFQKWRKEWSELVSELKEGIILSTVTA
jgi:CHAD domain-containing protein